MTTEITIENPRGNIDAATAMCNYINERKREILAQFRELEITEGNYNSPDVTNKIAELADAVEDLRNRGKELVKAVCSDTEALRVITQIDTRLWSYSSKSDPYCAYALLSSALKEAKDKIAVFKAKSEPQKPAHTYLVRITCTDDVLGKVLKDAVKKGAVDIVWCSPQSDKAVKAAQKLFEENV